jgi:hypothetical protein
MRYFVIINFIIYVRNAQVYAEGRRGGGGGGGGGGGAERRLNLNLLREIVCFEFPKSLEGKIRGNRGKQNYLFPEGTDILSLLLYNDEQKSTFNNIHTKIVFRHILILG